MVSSRISQLLLIIPLLIGLVCFQWREAAGNVMCYTNPLPPPGPVSYPSLTPVSPPGTYVYGNSYIWDSSATANPNSTACLTVTASGTAYWVAPALAQQTGVISGTYGFEDSTYSCQSILSMSEANLTALLYTIQTQIQSNLYGSSNGYNLGHMNSILTLSNLQCCNTSGCNQGVALTVGPFNGDKSRMTTSTLSLLGSALLSFVFMRVMIRMD